MANPFAIGGGAAVATGLVVGFGATKLMDDVAERHPTGSDADKPAGRIQWGAAGLGFASAAGGMVALATGRVDLGAALFGAGAGAMLGSFGAGIAFGARHGVGVDTSVVNVLGGYDHNRNGVIDMDSGSWWREPETIRTTTTRHEDSDGDVTYDTDTYSIERLATASDADRNWKVTTDELRTVIGGYDADGNGRIQKDELKRFEREVGERFLG
ncbi:MAG: hypothetical protein JWL76_2100 [Thermoleophilia bacterium]|nr:hypothetical protein [Thermoleophilia bacterium]